MKRSLLVLLLAVLLPSLGLGWLALRSAREQEIVLERRTAELYQKETDGLAGAVRGVISDERQQFAEAVRNRLGKETAPKLALKFAAALAEQWPQRAIGFALDGGGRLLSPRLEGNKGHPEWQRFLQENSAFFANRAEATVYQVPLHELAQNGTITRKSVGAGAPRKDAAQQSQQPPAQSPRNVAPQRQEAAESQLTWSTTQFRALTADAAEGVFTRFIDDRLSLIFWLRAAPTPEFVFGCQLWADDLQSRWPAALSGSEENGDYFITLLDDKAKPVFSSPGFAEERDWKHPFVATEIGEALPHWEAALYLRDPRQLVASARQARWQLYLLIGFALTAIATGGWMVFAETRRQLALAEKKTDFVSNVSHELKTPLTSIRMFAEMMHGGQAEPLRQPEYLRIIMVEAERLTRLLNNVLDFARLERGQRRFERRPCDFYPVLETVWTSQELHLREAGFSTRWDAAPGPYPILGEEDSLAQVIVNLFSNAEKYGGERKEIALHTWTEAGRICLSVLDRGIGVPMGEEEKIFEPFYRAHDSLSSGIPGSGLGLALARRVVREHGGEITYRAREGGGSDFTVSLPLAEKPSLLAL